MTKLISNIVILMASIVAGATLGGIGALLFNAIGAATTGAHIDVVHVSMIGSALVLIYAAVGLRFMNDTKGAE